MALSLRKLNQDESRALSLGQVDTLLRAKANNREQFGPHIYFSTSIDPSIDGARHHPHYVKLKALAEAWAAEQARAG